MPASTAQIDQVLATFAQAESVNRNCAFRQGLVVQLNQENSDEMLVSTDLHGNRLYLNRLLQATDLDQHPRRHLIMQEVCHGGPTYPIGGGCMSHLLLEDMAALKVRYPDRFHFLLSNHELAEVMDIPILKGRRMLNITFRTGLNEMYGDAADRVHQAAMSFLLSCPIAVRLANGVFICHSIPEAVDLRGFDAAVLSQPLDKASLHENSPIMDLVWGRDFRAENARAFAQAVGAKLLLTGHEPCEEGVHSPNEWQIIIDSSSRQPHYALLPTNGAALDRDAALRYVRAL